MRLLAARVDGLRSVVGVGWQGCRDLESDFDTSSTHALLVAPPALECPMLSDVRMQLRRSRQNRTFARQDSGQNNCAHPSGDRFRLTIRLCAHPSPLHLFAPFALLISTHLRFVGHEAQPQTHTQSPMVR